MDTQKNSKAVSRRKFIKGFIGAAIAIEAGWVLFGLVGKKKPHMQNATLFHAGQVSFFEKDKIYPFTSGGFYLSRLADGGFLAISTKCTHLGCIVQSDVQSDGFACPCHASKFNKYGEVLSPPATRALDVLPIVIENGVLKVDTHHPQKRQKFDAAQLTYL